MENTKLISMVAFVLEQIKQNNHRTKPEVLIAQWHAATVYAQFLKLPLSLGQFVPCTLENVPLGEPKWVSPDGVKWVDYVQQYKEACDRVLFEGFALDYGGDIMYNSVIMFDADFNLSCYTIEDLLIKVGISPTLTPSALKLIFN